MVQVSVFIIPRWNYIRALIHATGIRWVYFDAHGKPLPVSDVYIY